MKERPTPNKGLPISAGTHSDFETARLAYNQASNDGLSQEGFLIKLLILWDYRKQAVGYADIFDAMKALTANAERRAV